MKKLLIAMVLMAMVLSTPGAHADQNDPRLDEFFSVLNSNLTRNRAARVVASIWAAWLWHENDQVRELMAAGMRDMDTGHRRRALAKFSAAIKIAPDFAEAWNKRATAYYLLGDFTASAADVVKTLRLEPRHFGALAGQGMMHMQQDKTALALLYFRRALTANPHMIQVQHYIKVLSGDAKPI